MGDFRLWGLVGLSGVMLTFLGVAGLVAVSVPWLGTADEPHHLDYAWQVYQGTLPVWTDGPTIEIGRSLPSGQLAANHPPLYYLILAPLVGPLVESGDLRSATLVGRGLTLGLGLLALASASWSAYEITGKPRYAVIVPMTVSSLVPAVFFAGLVHNDVLFLGLAALGLGLSARLVRGDTSMATVSIAAIVGALGMATRVSFLGIFVAMLFAGMVGPFLIESPTSQRVRAKGAVVTVSVLTTVAAVAIGWFYWRNVQMSGTPFRAVSQEYAGEMIGRRRRSFRTLVATSEFRWLLPSVLYGRPLSADFAPFRFAGLAINQLVSVVVMLGSTTAFAFWGWRRRSSLLLRRSTMVLGGLLILQIPIALAQQIVHAVGWGAINPRYLLPGVFSIALLISISAGEYRGKMSGVLPPAIALLGWGMLLAYLIGLLSSRWGLDVETLWPELVELSSSVNGVPPRTVELLFLLMPLGLVFQIYSLLKLSRADRV